MICKCCALLQKGHRQVQIWVSIDVMGMWGLCINPLQILRCDFITASLEDSLVDPVKLESHLLHGTLNLIHVY